MDPLGYALYTLNGKDYLVNPEVKQPITDKVPPAATHVLCVFFIGLFIGMLF
ncbi:hypothetical protein L1D13_08945 [Vibrio tubiashii]|uniref:hypothetical protein n=1 Tax=Vibrio tubiashii TaxID=29498 RepID=UPI001EFDDC60|nr:hypothetical protein [Vibrio tubiashii]MCG9579910.1 hypothetical protein [Vibrio tubiashii]MCG9613501.1 hypothetical protein [Vibrio tubiashii]MCG9687050.1 hypothetical protein [Vibrio tubiashii]